MDKNFFINNRNKLGLLLPEKSVAVLFSGKEVCNSLDESLPFSTDRSFYYFTGIKEQNDILLIVKDMKARSVMFINPYDEYEAKWVGRKLFPNEVTDISGVEAIRYLSEFDQAILDYAKDGYKIYLDKTPCLFPEPYTEERRFIERFKSLNYDTFDLREFIAKIRMAKNEEEIAEIKKAIHLTNLGLMRVMQELKPGLYEYQVESFFDQSIKYNGASGHAFETIAASGKNACVLHYHANNSKLNDGDLMLFDLGAEFNLYKSDISRTYPISGKFTPRQRQIYNIVLEAQEVARAKMKPGVYLKEVNQAVVDFYKVKLKEIGLIKSDEEVSKYYFHSVSHTIGLDTHDISGRNMPLEVGSVISNEPGLYIAEEGIGIRIEDDMLITDTGAIYLSEEIIKDPDEIEKFMEKGE